MIVADASVLIVLSKIGRLRLLKALYGSSIIGPIVKTEVVDQGIAINAPGVRQVQIGLKEKWLREVKPIAREQSLLKRLLENARLDAGEAESLALANARKLMAAVDDKEARLTAGVLGLEYLGTAGILLAAFEGGLIDYDELEKAVRDLGKVMWLSADVVAEIFRTARGVKK
ncbi:MAG: hypothetical protein HY667_06575 [Chloroflexi bacterium]|nr:hypothetical protein [Chloroflexota bacterium]